MPEVRKQNNPNIIIAFSEEEAAKLKAILFQNVCFDGEPWAEDIYNKLDALEIHQAEYVDETWDEEEDDE